MSCGLRLFPSIYASFYIRETLALCKLSSSGRTSLSAISPEDSEGPLMSKNLIEFLFHFSDLYYNVIACFYVEICTIYQIYILQKFIAEMKIPARIRSERSSMAKVRSR